MAKLTIKPADQCRYDEVSIGEVTVDGENAEVQVTSTFMGETETHPVEVVRENGIWKVTDFGLNF